jgi:hypothetical protein
MMVLFCGGLPQVLEQCHVIRVLPDTRAPRGRLWEMPLTICAPLASGRQTVHLSAKTALLGAYHKKCFVCGSLPCSIPAGFESRPSAPFSQAKGLFARQTTYEFEKKHFIVICSGSRCGCIDRFACTAGSASATASRCPAGRFSTEGSGSCSPCPSG